eukprot:GDKK01061702.1.p1 GENE.GDKK01061702.1~~GDKK01061702.1.p1  ORF type:complete len:295 (+),score=23.97 GDKK01061702.1:20-904(+)
MAKQHPYKGFKQPYYFTPLFSSAWLQVFLHHHWYLWLILLGAQCFGTFALVDKYVFLRVELDLTDFMWEISAHLAAIVIVILEPLRLRIGYRGNLICSVPHLLLFIALTFIPSLCATIVLMAFDQFTLYKHSQAFMVVQFVFLLCELLLAIPLCSQVSNHSSIRFYLEKEHPGAFVLEEDTFKPAGTDVTFKKWTPTPIIQTTHYNPEPPPINFVEEEETIPLPKPVAVAPQPIEKPVPKRVVRQPGKGFGFLYSGVGGLNQRRKSIIEEDSDPEEPIVSDDERKLKMPPPGSL